MHHELCFPDSVAVMCFQNQGIYGTREQKAQRFSAVSILVVCDAKLSLNILTAGSSDGGGGGGGGGGAGAGGDYQQLQFYTQLVQFMQQQQQQQQQIQQVGGNSDTENWVGFRFSCSASCVLLSIFQCCFLMLCICKES